MSQLPRRRVLLAAGALLAPGIAVGQRPQKKWRIGFLSLDAATSSAGDYVYKGFPPELEKLGYRVGRNLEIEWRWAGANHARLPALASDLMRLPVDLIVARTTEPIQAAMNATRSIPIVMMNGNFPVELGLVQSLARPGGNVTGTSYISPEMLGKALQLLKEIAPGARKVAVPSGGSDDTPIRKIARDSMTRAGALLGITVLYFNVPRPEDVEAVLGKIAASGADSMLYLGDPVLRSQQPRVMKFVAAHKLATVATVFTFADQGGLVEYFPDPAEWMEVTARFVDRILKGANPADLPVQQPTRYLLTINLKTAKAIGLAVPASILVRADRVIEK